MVSYPSPRPLGHSGESASMVWRGAGLRRSAAKGAERRYWCREGLGHKGHKLGHGEVTNNDED